MWYSGICAKNCKKSDNAIQCDESFLWYHAECISMFKEQYQALNSLTPA